MHQEKGQIYIMKTFTSPGLVEIQIKLEVWNAEQNIGL